MKTQRFHVRHRASHRISAARSTAVGNRPDPLQHRSDPPNPPDGFGPARGELFQPDPHPSCPWPRTRWAGSWRDLGSGHGTGPRQFRTWARGGRPRIFTARRTQGPRRRLGWPGRLVTGPVATEEGYLDRLPGSRAGGYAGRELVIARRAACQPQVDAARFRIPWPVPPLRHSTAAGLLRAPQCHARASRCPRLVPAARRRFVLAWS
jgi:hypothetical protein